MRLNADFPLGQSGAGFRTWWRRLRGSDAELDDAHLREMAGTFARRLRAYCEKGKIVFIDAGTKERTHELAGAHLPADPTFRGLFAVIAGMAPAPIWEVRRDARWLRRAPVAAVRRRVEARRRARGRSLQQQRKPADLMRSISA